MNAHPPMEILRKRLGEIADVNAALHLLEWDQETYMPAKGATARGFQLATLAALAHRLFTDPEMGTLLESLTTTPLTDDESILVAETQYDYWKAQKLPESFVERFAQEQSKAFHAWLTARETASFDVFAPHLETLVALSREKAHYLGYKGSPYNALLDSFERGMTVETIQPLFASLAEKQRALIQKIVTAPRQPNRAWLKQTWNDQAQWDFSLQVLRDMGFDFEAGRQDRSIHPFTINFDMQDVRITTRVDTNHLFSCLATALHEGGHALYEQGIREADRRTPLAEAPSLGMHESQSRLWENMVGKSLPFCRHYLPALQKQFPGQLDAVSPEMLYAGLNHAEPSLIRVEADECTYNLHIILRFEIELGLIEGTLSVKEVPGIWNEKMRHYLGMEVPNDAQGCLQDVHWSHGLFGYFPTYTLGNLYAAQWFEAAGKSIPDLSAQIEIGDFKPLREWLRVNIHQFGRRKQAADFARDITGGGLSEIPYLQYLGQKYAALYGF